MFQQSLVLLIIFVADSLHLFADFKDDPELYVFPKLKYVGIELWQVQLPSLFLCEPFLYLFRTLMVKIIRHQVKSGTLFDNVLITDDPEYAKQVAEETWGKNKEVHYKLSCSRLSFPVFDLLSTD